jgi:hypothetical protein
LHQGKRGPDFETRNRSETLALRFSDFIAGLTLAEQATIKTRLNLVADHTGISRQFVLNLEEHERRLGLAAWEEIKIALLGSDEVKPLIAAIISACRGCCLQGGLLPPPGADAFWPCCDAKTIL